jgi:hypothetical protein
VNLQCEVEGLSPQEAHMHIALIALAVLCVAIAITASALNAIAISQKETRPDNRTAKFYSAPDYGIPHVAMPKGKKTFPPELVPVD